ncbi:MAG TPA: pilus assembly protein TadG-related protein, partial [Candidatus Limnocylindrales bacterium]|nr:pilus assembly protein TadG-related protein [Candidatus Limnocylindrales bacterium]
MSILPRRRRQQPEGEEGVIVVMFALSLVVLLALGALVYTGAQGLVLRRQLQNAGDAAALAAANLLLVEEGCSEAGNGGAPRAEIVAAALASVAINLPSVPASDVDVTCPAGWNNAAVKVDLHATGASYFSAAGVTAATTSTALNGQTVDQDYAVVLLDPFNATWPNARNGCPSFLVNGGITLTFEKSVIVNSKCTRKDSNNGAMKAINASFRMSLINGALMRIAGEYSANTSGKITPVPIENFRPLLSDPLAAIVEPKVYTAAGDASLPTVDMGTSGSGICRGQNPCILTPGTYPGGIAAGSGSGPSTLLLRPGVYYLGGGGLKLKSGSARILAIPSASVMTDAQAKVTFATTVADADIVTAWQSNCPLSGSTCGVMVYNAPSSASSWTTSGGNADQISNGSQGILLLRAYNPDSDAIVGNRETFKSYRNLVFWQARTPAPDATNAQPSISMAGGACVILSGTVYAAGGLVDFGGSSCGSGGGGAATA